MKSFPHIIEAVYFNPWAITREGWYSIERIVRAHVEGQKDLPVLKGEAETDFFGEPLPEMEIIRGVAHIPIVGPMLKGAGTMEKMCGACSHEDILSNIKVAKSMGVSAVVFQINSPGGTVAGTPELGNAIKAINVPTIATTSDLCCSAAYWLACSCDHIVATPSSTVGSVGVIMELLDASERYKALGLKVEQFTSGDLKGAGNPGIPLTEDQRNHFQSMVDKMGSNFRAWVTDNRSGVRSESMRGQAMNGDEALAGGLVDEVVNDLEELKFSY